jgi:hypothetical protein
METLDTEFAQAVRNVTVNGEKRERAQAAHTEVRGVLQDDKELCDWGISPRLIGSYARQTGRYPGKDVDVFLRFMDLSNQHAPDKIYDAVERVLVARYGLKDEDPDGRVHKQARSLKIDFPDNDDPYSENDFSIDAVPAVPWGEHWGIPNRERSQWNNDDKRWIKTNPIQFADDTDTLATATWSPTVNSANAYRGVVRLLRQVRHVHFGEQRPGGLFTEVAAYYVWNDQKVSGTTWAELLISTLEEVGKRFEDAAEDGLPDPILNTPMKPEVESWEWRLGAQMLTDLAAKGREALDAERCMAAKMWREILGENDRGPVLPLPEGCDAAGFPVGAVTAVSAVGSNQPRGFA